MSAPLSPSDPSPEVHPISGVRLAAMIDALTWIADIPLWGEPIADCQLKRDLAGCIEYDLEGDSYEPSSAAVSDFLEEAVDRARSVLGRGAGE